MHAPLRVSSSTPRQYVDFSSNCSRRTSTSSCTQILFVLCLLYMHSRHCSALINHTDQFEPNCTVWVAHNGTNTGVCGYSVGQPCASIQQAVDNAKTGSKICVLSDGKTPYSCPDDGCGVIVNKSLIFEAVNVVVDCLRKGRAFWLDNAGNVTIVGFHFLNGLAPGPDGLGGVVRATNTFPLVEHCQFTNNTAPYHEYNKTVSGAGGAIWVEFLNHQLNNAVIKFCHIYQ
jgi:hypothetical protein